MIAATLPLYCVPVSDQACWISKMDSAGFL